MLKIGQNQFAEVAVHGDCENETGIVRLSDRPPASVSAVDGDHVIVVANRLQIQYQRQRAIRAQRGGGEQRALEAVRGIVLDNEQRANGKFRLPFLCCREDRPDTFEFFPEWTAGLEAYAFSMTVELLQESALI